MTRCDNLARRAWRGSLGTTLLLALAAPVMAQTQAPVVRYACYVPGTGTVYLIKEPNTKTACTAPAHVEFSFTDGAGAMRPGDAASGDLGGAFPAPIVQALQGFGVSNAVPADGQVLTWDGAANQWQPKSQAAAGGDHGSLTGLSDDDHPQYLLLGGHRANPSGFSLSGAPGLGVVPKQGPGSRLMYAAFMGAFRVGSINAPFADGWDLDHLGPGSIALGHNAVAEAQNSIVIGSHVATLPGASSSIVIGVNRDPFRIIDTIDKGQVYIYADGGIKLDTGSGGCELPPGAGAFSCLSDVASKTDFAEIDAESVLSDVAALPISRWRYKGEADSIRHMGPTAQDFHAAFGLGTSDRHIGLLDAAGVSLAASKALAARTETLAQADARLGSDITALRAELHRLRAAYTDMIALVTSLQARLASSDGSDTRH